ncbi:MAG: aminoglycoside phosphotransferase family protein [Pseudonocardiales bacterium]
MESVQRRAARRAAEQVARQLGADPGRITHLPRGSTSWVFDLPGMDTVLIVARPGRSPADVAERVAAAGYLSGRLAFVVPVEPPISSETGLCVTVWRRVATRPGRPDMHALGRAVRALQEVAPAGVRACGLVLPDVQQLTDVVEGIERQALGGRLSAADARVLLDCAERLDAQLRSIDPSARESRVFVHGDLHLDNVLVTENGCVLCDTDELGLGGPHWDLAFLVDPGRSAALSAGEREVFQAGYGGPLPDDATARTFARIGHLRRTVRLRELSHPTPRERWWNHVRLGAWRAMATDWALDLQPAFERSRGEQVALSFRRPVRRVVGWVRLSR